MAQEKAAFLPARDAKLRPVLRRKTGHFSAVSAAGKFPHNVADKTLRIAKKHQRTIQVIEWVFNSCKARGHAALDDHDGSRLIHVKDRHSVNRAAGIAARGGIGHVVRADNQRHVSLWKI